MDESSSVSGMIKLTCSNYALWKMKMEDILYCKDLYEPILNEQKPEKYNDQQWQVLHRKAVGMIRQYIDHSVIQDVSDETDALQLWKKLDSTFARQTGVNKASLMRRLVKLQYKDGRSVVEHLNDFQGITNQLKGVGITLDDEVLALLLLSSLPDSWETLFMSLSNSTPKLSMEIVKNSILNEEARRKDLSFSSHSDANIVENRGRYKARDSQNYERSKSRGRSKSRTRKSLTCYYCKKDGHKKTECRKWKRDQAKEKNDKGEKADHKKDEVNTSAVATTNEVFLIGDDGCLNLACDECSWVIDSGASFHLTSHQGYFSSYTSGDFGHVRMGNDGFSKIVGIGDVCLETNTNCRIILRDVRHVPDIRLNLISAGKLDDEGYSNYFGEGKWKLTKGSLIAARGKKYRTLYVMQAKLSNEEVNAIEDDNSELWHKRLGHMSEKGLQILVKKQLLPGMKNTSLKPCVDCLAGKQHRVAFHRSSPSRRKHILDLVHTDVCSMSDKSLSGAQYFVTFIDDHSRKVWAFVLRTKDRVLDIFKNFHVKVERETGKKLKAVRADNGGEYRGPFEEYCRNYGIRLEKTIPKTPQQNGVAERMNRTISERIRSMLSHAKLPKSFWGEAMNTAVYLINLSPSVPLDGDIPNRVWTGKDVSYGHLKVFGCRAFVHISKDERSKLDSKTKQCIFLGYPQEDFGYRLWDPVEKKIIRSRDVVFFEDQTTVDFEKSDKPKSPSIPANLDPVPLPMINDEYGGDVEGNHEMVDNDTHEPEQQEEIVIPETAEEQHLRRTTRVRRPSSKYPSEEYVTLTDEGEPQCFQEAMKDPYRNKWLQAMQEEMNSLHENHTFELVPLPKHKRALKNKWVYRLKTEEGNSLPRYKARLVVKGFSQKKGIDFDEIFSPVVKMSSIRVVLALAASMDLEVEQLDVKTAFLHGDLEEEIYMEQPEGFHEKGKEQLVCLLKKSLYGLKQAPRQWYRKFESFMVDHGFKKTLSDHCVFVKRYASDDFIILLLYVDDMLIVGRDTKKISSLKMALSKSFAMKDLGPAKKMLGINIYRDRKNKQLWLSQERYIEKLLERFNMKNAKPVNSPLAGHFKLSSQQCPTSKEDQAEMSKIPYASAVGSLMYAMVCTRPDIAYAVGVVSRFLSNPGKKHWAAVKWILRYLRGTSKICLCFNSEKPLLYGYADADLAGDMDSRKSTSGYMMTFAGGAVSWQSKLQKCVALSTTEAEYIAATEATKELLWMKNFLQELGSKQESFILYCDNQSAIHLAKNPAYHSRTKHIDVRYHWIRDKLESKLLQLEKIHTDENGSDMMTKILPILKFEKCCMKAGLVANLN